MPGEIDVEDVLRRVPGWSDDSRIIGYIEGGMTNRNLRIEITGEQFVVRLPGRNTQSLEIDRQIERIANERANALGFAPEVVALIEPEECLVTRFINGELLLAADFSDPEVIRRIAAMLRAFHNTPPLAHDFNAFDIPRLHCAAAVGLGVPIPDAYLQVSEIVEEISKAFAVLPEALKPCHNDLLLANFVIEGPKIWLLDWEYAGMNNPFFDLANLANNASLTAEAEVELVGAYYGSVSQRNLARMRLMKILSDARESMWAVVQQGNRSLDFDYIGYASEHFDRLFTNAASPGYRSLLEAAALTD